jgi:beta-mannosidase
MQKISLNGNDWLFKEFVGMDWVWRNSVKADTRDTRWWYQATVPGSVLNDLMDNQMVPDPHFELNSKLVEWVSARTWVYKKSFRLPADVKGQEITLCLEGIDYKAEIFVNGKQIGTHEGMFLPFSKNITDLLLPDQDNLLAVVIDAAPMEQPQVGKSSMVRTHKTRMNYWWDFCPRMIHQGIWDEVYLKISGQALLKDVYVSAVLNEDYSTAVLTVEIETELAEGYELTMKADSEVLTKTISGNKERLELEIRNPKLWQPNGYGEPYQYSLSFELKDQQGGISDEKKLKFGIREIEFVKNENCNPEAAPFTLKVNGRKIYVNGYNWVPIDALYGVERPEKLHRLIQLAKEAHTVMFRVWGGGLIEKDSFYETCAENGILVWQEFIQSSSGIDNKPPEDPAFIDLLLAQAEIIIKRKRNHTSLAIWCGGNELSDWEGNPVENSDLLIGKLKEVVERLDPQRRWLSSSPSGGVFNNNVENILKHPDQLIDVHGPWEHQGLQKHCELYNMGTSLFHTEFGVEGMTNKNTLDKTIAPEHMLPASKENEIYFHRGAWWTNEPLVQETFGGLDTIDKIRTASQYMQFEGLKYAVECNRRRAFQNSGTFPWQFNEPYPNAYCTSNLDYYGNPKPVYYGIRNCYSPILVSASFASPSLYNKAEFSAQVYLTTSLLKKEANSYGEISLLCELVGMDGRTYYTSKTWERLPENSTKEVLSVQTPLQEAMTELMLLRLSVFDENNNLLCENEYLFTLGNDLGPVFKLPKPELSMKQEGDILIIQNNGENAALFLFLSSDEELPQSDYLYFDRNYLSLMPKEEKSIAIKAQSGQLQNKAIRVESFLNDWAIKIK